ncbi:MAG: carbon-nitrogen hydrolase family protein [Phycisphaeraceae bacterium]
MPRTVLTALLLATLTLPLRAAEPTEKPTTVRVAAIQFISAFADPAANRKGLQPLIREAAKNGAKIIVLPETAITGYMPTDLKRTWQVDNRELSGGLTGVNPKDAAETVPGQSTKAFAALAGELGIYLTIPLLEVDKKSGEYFNTIVLADPEGKIVLHYRKLNPWPWAERGWATTGDRGHQYIDSPYGRLGLLICYDINFEPPKLKKKKVDHLLYCIAWVDDENSTWFKKQLPAIAKENNLNIIGANWSLEAAIEKPDWHGYGNSLIISNEGNVMTKVKSDFGNEIIYAELKVP